VERLEGALREIEAAPSRWATCDEVVRYAQAGRWSVGRARAALADDAAEKEEG